MGGSCSSANAFDSPKLMGSLVKSLQGAVTELIVDAVIVDRGTG